MNSRVGFAVVLIIVVFAIALVLRRTQPVVQTQAVVTKPTELNISKATLQAAQKAAEASTKQSNAVQDNATKVAAQAKPSLEGYSFLTENAELILSYQVNFNPIEKPDDTDKFALALAENWRIKELESYKPKKVIIEFYGGKDRIKAIREFSPEGKPL
jgi:hypothetical protein